MRNFSAKAKMIKVLRWVGGVFGLFVIAVTVCTLIAIDPGNLVKNEKVIEKPIAVKLAEPPKAEERIEPAKKNQEASLMSTLAPDSLSNSAQDVGGGMSFGSGGFGPAVGGGGGFGASAVDLAKDKDNIHRPPRLLSKGTVEYPAEARQKNISGFVVLKILVALNGAIEKVEILESEPQGVFDQSATRSIKGWRFEPAIVKGELVAAWTQQKIKFELN